MRVGADERVRECNTVSFLDHARQVLDVDLVADPGSGRHELEVPERLLSPAEEHVALAVSLELALDVDRERTPGRELVDLHTVVDHQLDRDQRVDLLRIAAHVVHRVAHRCEVDDRGHTRQVLHQHAAGREADLAARLVLRDPGPDRLDVLVVARTQHVLEEDPQRVRKACDIPFGLKGVEPVDPVIPVAPCH